MKTVEKSSVRKLKDSASKQVKYYGICTTCNFASECKSATNPFDPVWQCEGFDDHTESARERITVTRVVSSPDYGKFKGLCMNCEKREECSMAGTEGGIWHCEEYA